MKKTCVAFNINGNEIIEQKEVSAEVTGQCLSGEKVWTDNEGNQYTLHRWNTREYFILEAVDYLETTWKI